MIKMIIITTKNLYNNSNFCEIHKSNFCFGLKKHVCFVEECYDLLPPEVDLAPCALRLV